MKYLRTIIFLSFFIPLFANAQITLDLNKAVQTGLEKNDKIKQYEEKSYQKEIEFNQTTSNFLPKIDLTASFNHLNDNISIDLNPIRDVMLNIQAKNQVEFTNIYTLLQGGAPLTQQQRALLFKSNYSALNSQIPQFVEQMKKQDYWSTYIQGVQPLFLGGKLIGARQYASLEKQLADAETRKVKDEVTSEIINNYLNVIMVQDIIKTRKNVLDGMIKHRDNAKKLFDDGLIAKHQYLRGEVAVADAESNLNDETNKLNLAYTALKSSIGLSEQDVIQVNDSLVFAAVRDSVQYYKNLAYIKYPAMEMINLKRQETDVKKKIDRSEFLPKIGLFGRFEFFDNYLSMIEPRWVIGVQGSINLFNGFKDKQNFEMTQHLKNEIDYAEAETKRKLNLWVESSYTEMKNAEDKYFRLQTNIDLSLENLRLTTARFSTGLGTSLDVVDAELVLEKNQIDRTVSVYNYYKSLNEILKAAGSTSNFLEIWKNKEK